MYTSVNQC